MDFLLEKNLQEEKPHKTSSINKINKCKTQKRYFHYTKIRTNLNLEDINKIKRHKTKRFGLSKNFSSTAIIKNNSNLFKSLMSTLTKNNNNNINNVDNGDNNENNENNDNNPINKTFVPKTEIKKKLLKEYNEYQKFEKKYRKIKITSQLYDSMVDNEESAEESEDDGTNFYLAVDSSFIFIYDMLLIFFTFYTLMFIPISLAKIKYFCEKEKKIYEVLNIINELIYIFDILISFFRSYYNYEYKIITNNKKIINNYLKNGFISDLIEAFPSYAIRKKICYNCNGKYTFSNSEMIISILLILKIFKIFKVFDNKKNRVIEVLYEKISKNYSLEKIINVIIYIIFIISFCHSLICIHIFIGKQNYPNWMVFIHIENKRLYDKYISSFYFIITTMTTVGYGDITCKSSVERTFQIILLAIGTLTYSFIITTIGNYIEKQNNIKIQLDNQKNILEQIRITHPLMPFHLYYKIQDYLVKKAYKLENNKKMEIRTLVNGLPDKIRNDMLKIIYKDIIINFKMFKDCKNSNFIIKMLTCFVQTTCKKDVILLEEGKKIENIIFVKDGRLILEATIDLLDPLKSIKKYFNQNFKDMDPDNKSKKNSNVSGEEDKENNEEKMNLSYLEKKLNNFIESNKTVVSKAPIFETNNPNNETFQMAFNDNSFNNEEDSAVNENKENCQFLKIIDIRKNEHFGDIFMLAEKPSPLTLKVKSKIAEIFLLRKKDAININHIHHNIVNRIKAKSYKNIISLRRKTIKILTKYFDFNKFTKGKIQDMSWFNSEKSRNITFLDNLNNTSPNQKTMDSKQNVSLFAKKRNLVRNSCVITKRNSKINTIIQSNLKKSITNTASDKKDNNYLKISNVNNLKSPERFKNIKFNLDNSQKNNINISNNDLNSNFSPNTNEVFSDKKNSINDYNIQNNNTNISKDINNTKNNINELEITKKEDDIITLNKMNSTLDKNIRKKIQSRVKKERIINLWKFQNEIINSKLDNDKTYQITNLDEYEQNLTNNNENIQDLKFFLYNKLLEYLSSDSDSETESTETKIKKFNDTNIKPENAISFNIKSSYYNLIHLTKGKIIENSKIKNELKIMIKKYVKETITKLDIKKSKKRINRYASQLSNNFTNKKFFSNNFFIKGIKDIDSISSISKSSVNTIKTNNSKKLKSSEKNKHINDKKCNHNIISNRIKQTINNKTDIFINFKNTKIDNKHSKGNFENNFFNQFFFSEILAENKKNAKNESKSSKNLIYKNKDLKLTNIGSSKSAKKRLKNF